jgi:hypothetical protein
MIALFFILVFAAGIAEGLMDFLQFHYRPIFKNELFWNPELSWKNKYKDGDPMKGPKFLFSTTLFVALTDGWHTMKLLRNVLLFVSLPFIGFFSGTIVAFLIYGVCARIVYGLGFYISYEKL